MNTELIVLSPALVVLVPIVVGLTQIVKRWIDSRWVPVTAIVFGILGAFLVVGFASDAVLSGIVIGLSAVGLYGTGKTTAGN